MAEIDIDFEGTGGNTDNGNPGAGGAAAATANGNQGGEGTTDLNGGGTSDVTGKDGTNGGADTTGNGDNNNGNNGDNGDDNKGGKGDDNNSSTGELTPGTKLEIDGSTYTVADNGDVVDEKGNIVKPAAEVKDWLASFDEEESNELSIDAIQESLGVEVTDENGKPVEFSNDAAGVKAYVNAVLELKSQELQDGAINKLYAENPMLKEFQDYVTVTGSPIGFGELPDRSGITVDKDNVNQQEIIIKTAAREFGNTTLNDNYIKYLKDTGGLYDEAVAQLQALQDKDTQVRAEIAQRAEAARQQEEADLNEYWNQVNNVINSGTIAGYKLPASFVKEVDGKKQTLTPKDFFNYLSRHTEVSADGNKITAYQKDLEEESQEDYLNRELLTAWLKYTGGSYKDLADMAVKEEEVRVLKLKSKQNATRKTVKVVKPQQGKASFDDILLG